MFRAGNSEIFKYASGMIDSWACKDGRARILDRHGKLFLAAMNEPTSKKMFSPFLDT
jgi:hypothetical protein